MRITIGVVTLSESGVVATARLINDSTSTFKELVVYDDAPFLYQFDTVSVIGRVCHGSDHACVARSPVARSVTEVKSLGEKNV